MLSFKSNFAIIALITLISSTPTPANSAGSALQRLQKPKAALSQAIAPAFQFAKKHKVACGLLALGTTFLALEVRAYRNWQQESDSLFAAQQRTLQETQKKLAAAQADATTGYTYLEQSFKDNYQRTMFDALTIDEQIALHVKVQSGAKQKEQEVANQKEQNSDAGYDSGASDDDEEDTPDNKSDYITKEKHCSTCQKDKFFLNKYLIFANSILKKNTALEEKLNHIYTEMVVSKTSSLNTHELIKHLGSIIAFLQLKQEVAQQEEALAKLATAYSTKRPLRRSTNWLKAKLS